MAAITFDTLKCARRLKAAGFTDQNAEGLAEIMAEAFVANVDNLVTKDYLDARLAIIQGQIRLLFWAQGLTIAVIVLPQLKTLLGL